MRISLGVSKDEGSTESVGYAADEISIRIAEFRALRPSCQNHRPRLSNRPLLLSLLRIKTFLLVLKRLHQHVS